MSYILDALRKSDQQRKRGLVPTLASMPASLPASEPHSMLFHGLLVAILLSSGAAIAWLRPWAPEPVVALQIAPAPRASAVPPLASIPVPLPIHASSAHEPQEAVVPVSRPKLPAQGRGASRIRPALPPMSVAVHAYSRQPGDRLVSIDGRMLKEGDELTPDLRLEQITPDGMVFIYRGERIRRRAR